MVPFRTHIGVLLVLAAIFFVNFLSRIVFSPLLAAIEEDLRIGHAVAGSLFLFISIGYCAGLLVSGFISSRVTHKTTIVISSLALGICLLLIPLGRSIWWVRSGLLLLGLAAGIYLPSGMAALTASVSQKDWGKAVAVHELAPNIGFVAAPLIAEGLLQFFSWGGVISIIGVAAVIVGLAFACLVRIGVVRGEAPSLAGAGYLFRHPPFLAMVALFSLAIGGSLGVYTMLPLYLVAEHGVGRVVANQLIALSRIAGVGAAFVAGWLSDRWGRKMGMRLVMMATGLATIVLGVARGHWIIPFLFLQPMLAVCFFPPGFASLAEIVPPRLRTLAVSLTIPIAFFFGGGVFPAFIGLMAQWGFFPHGIVLVGASIISGVAFLRYLAPARGHAAEER